MTDPDEAAPTQTWAVEVIRYYVQTVYVEAPGYVAAGNLARALVDKGKVYHEDFVRDPDEDDYNPVSLPAGFPDDIDLFWRGDVATGDWVDPNEPDEPEPVPEPEPDAADNEPENTDE